MDRLPADEEKKYYRIYLLVWYFIWLPKPGLFDTEPRKNTFHLLIEKNKETKCKRVNIHLETA